jgi:hypothetical protein
MEHHQHHQQHRSTIPPEMKGNAEGMAMTTAQSSSATNHGSNRYNNTTASSAPLHMMGAILHGTGTAGPGMNSQIMGQLMTNPALAAAAAASPLFPPAAIMTNPGAFLTMPEYYTSATALQHDQNAKDSAAVISSAVAVPAHQIRSSQASQSGFPLSNPSQQQQSGGQMFPVPPIHHPIMAYGAAIPHPGLTINHLAPSSVQAHMAASAAASQAIADGIGDDRFDQDGEHIGNGGKRKKDMTPAERAKLSKERNREHAKSTRLRKKAYLQKLKELVEGLHAERTEEVRQRRVAIQHLAEMQNVRRGVIRSFLRYHSNYERDKRKWETILDDTFWLKQPVTPYRYFRRSEIEQVSPCSNWYKKRPLPSL